MSPEDQHVSGLCIVVGCERARRRNGLCNAHWCRVRRHGDVRADIPLRPATEEGRFWSKVRITDSCWQWEGATNGCGYGNFVSSRTKYAHRWAYESRVGPIPDGLELDHICRNRSCVNPDHLEPVTRTENVRRSFVARGFDEHCGNGHVRTDDNWVIERDGRRNCLDCRKESNRKKRGRSA